MVYYQKTPARIIFEVELNTHLTNKDIFYDVGSDLGQVAIFVNLLSGVRSAGIEFEPEFCRYAQDSATALKLFDVTLVNVDARKADFSRGTVSLCTRPSRAK